MYYVDFCNIFSHLAAILNVEYFKMLNDVKVASLGFFISKVSRSEIHKKVQLGKDQEKAQSEKDSHSKNRGGKKPNQQSGTYTMKHIVSRMSSYFPNSYFPIKAFYAAHISRSQAKSMFGNWTKQTNLCYRYSSSLEKLRH